MSTSVKALAAAVSGSLVIGFAVAAVSSASISSDRKGVVERIIDGDTLVASVAGQSTTIRLLNIDTPETKHPDQPVQCLGSEATEWLEERLPIGTKVGLKYDKERTDLYGRTLAGVFEDGSLVNAEIARVGLGVPAYFAPNDRFLREVEAAAGVAKGRQIGLFDPNVDCALPAQVRDASTTAEAIPATYQAGVSLDDAAAKVAAVAAIAASLRDGDLRSLGNAVLHGEEAFVAAAGRSAHEAHELAKASYKTLISSEAEHRAAEEAAKRAEAERLERERVEREQREAAERAEKERVEREQREAAERVERERVEREAAERAEQERREREARERAVVAERERAEQAERDRAQRQRETKPPAPKTTAKKTTTKTSGKCVPYGPEIPYSNAGGYTGKRYGMPGGKTFRKCS